MRFAPLFRPVPDRAMRVAGFLSGSGTNLVRILEHERRLDASRGCSPYRVVVIFTDNAASNAGAIGERFDIPVVTNDIMEFYRSRGHADKRDLTLRPAFDESTIDLLREIPIDVVALAGYMSIVTKPLLERFPGHMINVHPADLCVRDGNRRLYTGARAVDVAIAAGERHLRSSVHIVRAAVDYGEVLLRSAPIPVHLPAGESSADLVRPERRSDLRRIADEHQTRLKERGDWEIFPRALEWIADGRYGFDEMGGLCFDGGSAPSGVLLDERGEATIASGKDL
ncbi:MAG: formyl transferase [Deltaproteobacteria bacterium]|nr:formyl transferase [Deltaproteobacteria bacterium]